MQKRLLLKVASIFFLILLLLVPLGMIGGIVTDRQHLQLEVEKTVANSFAGPQRLVGPLLVVPYIEREIIVSTDDKGKELKRTIEHQRQILLVPEQLGYDGTADVEAKYKGLYKALVYQTKGAWRARFEVPVNLGLDINPSLVSVGNAYLAFGLSDVRGLRGSPKLTWGGQEITVKNGTKLDGLGDGLHADLGILNVHEAHQYEVTVNMDLAGMRSLAFAPIGKITGRRQLA